MRSKGTRRGKFLHRILFRYFPYWPLFAALTLLAVFFAWCYLFLTPPVYEIRARLLFEGHNMSSATRRQVARDTSSTQLNEYAKLEVLTSRSLMENIVRDLSLSSQVYNDGFFHDRPAFASAPIIVQVKNIERVQKKEVPLSFQSHDQLVLFDGKSYRLNSWIRSYYGEIRFMKNERSPELSSGDYYVSFQDFRVVTNDLIHQIKVKPDQT